MDEPKLELKVKATGDWEEVRKLLQTLKKGGKLWEGVIAMEAKNAATLVKRNHASQGKLTGTTWPKLASLTRRMKKSKRMLFESGQLAKAIGAQKNGNTWFIGVITNDAHKGSKIGLQDLARVHEYGTTIVQQWTAKQRAMFFMLLKKYGQMRRGKKKSGARPPAQRDPSGRFVRPKAIPKGAMVVVIKIPARPFVFPVLRRLYLDSQDTVERRILARMKSALKIK